jgi:hypothetical protein
VRVFQSAKFIRQVNVDADAANCLRQIPDYLPGICCVPVNVNGKRWRSAAGHAHRRAEHFRLFHPFARNLVLDSYGSANGWMIVIQCWAGVRRKWTSGEKDGEKTGNDFQQ